MTKRFHPPLPHRIGAVAIAAALAAFAGVAAAQPSAAPAPKAPGYAVSSDGQIVRNGFGECVRAGHWNAANAAEPCERVTLAQAAPVAAAPAAAAAGPAGAQSAAAGSTGTSMQAAPGYVQDGQSKNVVLSGFGTCVRSGFWTPAMAAEPCDRIAVAQVQPPPAPVAAAPEPKLEPAPQPLAQAQPAPAPLAPEPPRPVIQKLTLSTDVLFDFNKAELKEGGKQRLDELASQIKDADVDEIVATGHADRIASEEYNQKLSEARAQAVKDYLQGKVSNARTVTAEGKGESKPVTGDDCKKMGAENAKNQKLIACLQPDRRVEIEVLGSRQVAGGAPAAGSGTTGSSSAPAGGGSTTR